MEPSPTYHHDVNDNRQPERSVLSNCQVLIWPVSLLKNQRKVGFVLGWQTDDDNNNSNTGNCLEFPSTAIVAGILPATTHDVDSFHQLNNQVERVKHSLCWCCTCSKTGNGQPPLPSPSSCSGCIRRHLFESVRVLAWYNHSEFSSHEKPPSYATTLSLATIYHHKDHTTPWIEGWDKKKRRKQYQILYYNDTDQICYHNPRQNADVSSVLTRDILPRLSSASIVLSLIKEGVPPKPVELPATSPLVEETTNVMPEKIVETNAIFSYSIFWQLLLRLYHRQDRLHGYELALSLGRKNRVIPPICTQCGKCCKELSRAESIEQTIVYWNNILRAIVDIFAGVFLLAAIQAALLRPMDNIEMLRNYFQRQSRLVQDGASWLETFPIGFKLNEPLTISVGREIRSFVCFHEFAVLQIIRLLEVTWVRNCCLGTFAIAATTLGASGVLAILLDLLRLAHVHLEILSLSFRGLFRSELYLLSTLWRVFRGKKRNVLRNRTDSMEYDSIQLLLGSILFAVTLFQFTTILVYHVFFAVCHLVFAMTLNFLCSAIVWLREWPAGIFITRCLYHRWYATDFDIVGIPSNVSTISTTSFHPTVDSIFEAICSGLQSHILKFMDVTISQTVLALFGETKKV